MTVYAPHTGNSESLRLKTLVVVFVLIGMIVGLLLLYHYKRQEADPTKAATQEQQPGSDWGDPMPAVPKDDKTLPTLGFSCNMYSFRGKDKNTLYAPSASLATISNAKDADTTQGESGEIVYYPLGLQPCSDINQLPLQIFKRVCGGERCTRFDGENAKEGETEIYVGRCPLTGFPDCTADNLVFVSSTPKGESYSPDTSMCITAPERLDAPTNPASPDFPDGSWSVKWEPCGMNNPTQYFRQIPFTAENGKYVQKVGHLAAFAYRPVPSEGGNQFCLYARNDNGPVSEDNPPFGETVLGLATCDATVGQLFNLAPGTKGVYVPDPSKPNVTEPTASTIALSSFPSDYIRFDDFIELNKRRLMYMLDSPDNDGKVKLRPLDIALDSRSHEHNTVKHQILQLYSIIENIPFFNWPSKKLG